MNAIRRETYEQRLKRLFEGWTDEEVLDAMKAIREVQDHNVQAWANVWREYARRTFSDNVVCHRCGSENHGTAIHDDYA